MATVSPLRAWRVLPEHAQKLAAVPYDVINREEAYALAHDNPLSFLHVTKPEIDLPSACESNDSQVYQQGARALKALMERGILRRDVQPCFYAYALTLGNHRQVGVVLGAAVKDYEANIVRKHEYTRPDKENDRVWHMQALQAQSGKVFLVHRPDPTIAEVLKTVTKVPAPVDFVADDGVRHELWIIDSPQDIHRLTDAFDRVGTLYIADGHHRAAAAARVAGGRRAEGHPLGGAEFILSVAFARDQVQILPYHRVVRDLGGRSSAEFRHALEARFTVEEGRRPSAPQQFGMYINNAWFSLRPKDPPGNDCVQSLDVSILQDRVLQPLLGINDPRRDKRIDFVGGIRGLKELERRVQDGWAVAFSLHPTSMGELLTVADSGAVMPPKSTWFEPKLRDGLVVASFE